MTTVCASLCSFLHPKKGHTLNKSDFRNVDVDRFYSSSAAPFFSHYSKLNNKIHKNVGVAAQKFIHNFNLMESLWVRAVVHWSRLSFCGVDINFSPCQPRRQQEVVSSVSVSLHIMCRWCRHKTEKKKRKYNKHFPWPLQDDSRFSSYAFCCASDLYRHTT